MRCIKRAECYDVAIVGIFFSISLQFILQELETATSVETLDVSSS